jgi:hypothetical protein
VTRPSHAVTIFPRVRACLPSQIKHLLSRAPEGNVAFRILHFTRELAQ